MKREEVLETTRHNMMLDVDRRDVLNAKGKPCAPEYMLQVLDTNHPRWREIKDIEAEVQEIIDKALKQHNMV